MNAPLRLHLVATGDRQAALASVRDAVLSAGGWIEDVHLFSDLLATLKIELPPGGGPPLVGHLRAAGFALGPDFEAAIAALDPGAVAAGTLTVTFTEGTGDLRRVVPAVPG